MLTVLGVWLARSGKFGRFVSSILDRTNRTRNILVLLMACALAGGCGRDYIMPPAKVKLPGYQAESLYSEGLCVVSEQQERRRGYMDLEGRIVIAPQFFAAGPFNGGLAPVQRAAWDRYGYIDRQGRTVIEPRFDAALAFAGELAPVRVDGQWGFIDRQGRAVVPPRFDLAFAFSDERARVVVTGFAGFIDESGHWVVEPQYYRAGDYREGLAMVCNGRLCGFIDRAGDPVIALEYDDAGSFAEGLAAVRKGALWGYIDREGRMAIPPIFDQAEPFADGLARVSRHGQFDGFIDREGRPLIELASSIPGDYERFARHNPNARFGYIDPGGRTVIDHTWRTAQPFSEGLAFVESPYQNRQRTRGYVDATGQLAFSVPDEIARTLPFTDGLALVARLEQGRFHYGYMDRAGELVIEARFAAAHPFSEGLAAVRDEAGRTGYITRDGSWAIEPLWLEEAHSFAADRVRVKLNGHYGFLNATGSFVVPPRYLGGGDFHEGLAAVALPTRPKTERGVISE